MARFFASMFVLALVGWSGVSLAQAPVKPDPRVIARQLDYKSGAQPLGLVAEVRGETLAFLNPGDARKLLEDIWENPPGSTNGVLGVLVPKGFDPLRADNWAIVVSYEKTGYVTDDDADEIDYAGLLKEMQEATREENAKRVKEGYQGIELVGWASKPFYEKASHKLHWAKELHFSGMSENTLNYNLRALGRQGVLELNFVAGMGQLAEIRAAIPKVMAEVNFKPGYRYEEFDSKVDDMAGYGIAALIAGGVLKKVGFFGIILAALVAFKKFVVFGVVAAIGGIVAFVRRRQTRRPLS